MKKVLDWAFSIIGGLMFAVGVFLILSAMLSDSEETLGRFSVGLLCVVSYFFTIGFSYIVEAAIVYLDKQKEK